jgi:hypothetical protein
MFSPKIQRSFIGFIPKPALLPVLSFNVVAYIAYRLLEKAQIENLKIYQLDLLSDRLLAFKTLKDLDYFLDEL